MNGVTTKKTSPQQSMEQIHLIIFRLEKQAFALPIEAVYQIVEMVSIRPVPKVNPIVEGVINVHGRMIPAIDLRRLLYNSSTPRSLHTPIILTYIKGQMTGLIVDEVLNVTSVYQNEISKPSDFLPVDVESIPILRGLTHNNQEPVILLELDYLFKFGQTLSQVSETLNELHVSPTPRQIAPPESYVTGSVSLSGTSVTKSEEPEAVVNTEVLPDIVPAPNSTEVPDSAQGFERVAKALEEMHRDASPEPGEILSPDEPHAEAPIELPAPPAAPAEIPTANPPMAASTHNRRKKRAHGE